MLSGEGEGGNSKGAGGGGNSWDGGGGGMDGGLLAGRDSRRGRAASETAGVAARHRRRQAQPRSSGDCSQEEASGCGDGREEAGGKQNP